MKLKHFVHKHRKPIMRTYGAGHVAYFTQIAYHYIHVADLLLGFTGIGLAGLGVVIVIYFEAEG